MANFIGVGAVSGSTTYTGVEPAAGSTFHGPIRTDQGHVLHYGNTSLRAVAFDADTATTLSLGTANATQINIGSSGIRTDFGGYVTINGSPSNQDGININKSAGISSASDICGVDVWGASNIGGGASIGFHSDSGWNYGAKHESNTWLTDNVYAYFGTSRPSSIIYSSGTTTLAMACSASISINPSSTLTLTSSTANVDINASTNCTIDAGSGGISLDSPGNSNFSTSAGTMTVSSSGIITLQSTGSYIDMNAGTYLDIDAASSSYFTVTGGAIFLEASTNINLTSGSTSSRQPTYVGGSSDASTRPNQIAVRWGGSGSTDAGELCLRASNGTWYALWVDGTGDLRIQALTGDPASYSHTADTGGTVVGTQT